MEFKIQWWVSISQTGHYKKMYNYNMGSQLSCLQADPSLFSTDIIANPLVSFYLLKNLFLIFTHYLLLGKQEYILSGGGCYWNPAQITLTRLAHPSPSYCRESHLAWKKSPPIQYTLFESQQPKNHWHEDTKGQPPFLGGSSVLDASHAAELSVRAGWS